MVFMSQFLEANAKNSTLQVARSSQLQKAVAKAKSQKLRHKNHPKLSLHNWHYNTADICQRSKNQSRSYNENYVK
jgi:hypothetical protein